MNHSREPQHQLADIGAACLVFHEGRVLLVQMAYGRNNGQWILPGGMVEVGENPHEAATREVFEETGLEVEVEKLFAIRHRLHTDRPGNTYWIFKTRLKTPTAEIAQRLRPQQVELHAARFWDVDEALRDSTVRPLTQRFIRLAVEGSSSPTLFAPPESTEKDFIYL